MSKFTIFIAVLIMAFASCQEEKATLIDEVTIVKIPNVKSNGSIDWNYEISLIESESVRQKAAATLDLDAASLPEIEIEADITNQQIRILGPHGNAVADAYKSIRLEAKLTQLEENLQNQSGELFPIKPAGNPDQMTYEKALQALEEEPANDGIIYRKTPEE